VSEKPSKSFNPRQWGVGVNKIAPGEKPEDPNATRLKCTVSGAKPRFLATDHSFAIWSAVFDQENKKETEVTIIGPLAQVSSGEMLDCKGKWKKDQRYGWQFRVFEYKSALPTNASGVAEWLKSRIDGVGPAFAKAIVDHFGADHVFNVLDQDPNRIREVKTKNGRGLPEAQVEKAIAAWDDVRAIRQIETFLFSYGITSNMAERLYRFYGEDVVEVLKETPYKITELRGIGFRGADTIAKKMGVKVDDPARIESAILYCLEEGVGVGHVFLSLEQLLGSVATALKFEETNETADPKQIVDAASRLAAQGDIVVEPDEYLEQRIYTEKWHTTETRVARTIRDLLASTPKELFPKPERPKPKPGLSDKEIAQLGLPTDAQWEIIDLVRKNRLAILTGGPGVGKSFSQQWLMNAVEKRGLKVHLCAPTGKAARRMAEITGHDAKTIHRLLGFSPFEGGFTHNAQNKLEGDLLLVDETSMLSLDLADSLFQAVPDNMHILLVGDPDQLPPVGAGKLFDDLIKSDLVPRVHLTEIFRQAARSMIIQNSRRINSGKFPYLKKEEAEKNLNHKMLNDFFWFPQSSPEKTFQMTIDLAVNRVPRTFGLDPKTEIMVLAPMRRGVVGIDALNERLEEDLNPLTKSGPDKNNDGNKKLFINKNKKISIGSRIIQTKNYYSQEGLEKSIMNGEVAYVKDFSLETALVTLIFEDGRELVIPSSDMDTFQLAWATTVHKYQGSSMKAVITPVSTSAYTMLTRGLTYTAVTRAEELCVLVGEKKALAIAIDQVDMKKRNSSLVQRITDPSLSGELF
jgi:exodeoxyribonuclease V alpha subunit